jgi:hypothetical protein
MELADIEIIGGRTTRAARRGRAVIVQLPFPALSDPCPPVRDYYRDYSARYAEFVHYFLPEDGLWELPLWVAHLAGMLRDLGIDASYLDLTKEPFEVEECTRRITAETGRGDMLLLSPLAQNLDLAVGVSRAMMAVGRFTVLGGNMAPLIGADDASRVHLGILTPQSLAALLRGGSLEPGAAAPARESRVTWRPDYSLLTGYRGQVPLLRLNASHGCLNRCTFCGDAWSRQLYVVDPEVLEHEVRQLEELFPGLRLIYIGDKTFGQSKEAMSNLLAVFARRPEHRFIVQTTFTQIREPVIDVMRRLGVVAVELGFEGADIDLLQESSKATLGMDHYYQCIEALTAEGMHVVLNILGGLPGERRCSHELTVEFMKDRRNKTWLYNLYSFVPYPLTPVFPTIRDRIFDWSFANWREDSPPVYQPFHLSADESYELFLAKVETAHQLIRRRQPPRPRSRRRESAEKATSSPQQQGM